MPRVFGFRNDRLGTVLVNLCHAWRFARRVDFQFTCVWPRNHPKRGFYPARDVMDWPEMHPPFALHETLFKVDDRLVRLDKLVEVNAKVPITNTFEADGTEDVYYPLVIPFLVGNDTVVAATAETRLLARSLPFSEKVLSAVADLRSRHDLSKSVAVHLRRGDIVADVRSAAGSNQDRSASINTFAARYADIEAYVRAIEAFHPRTDVLVFSDEPDSIEEFRRKAPTNVTASPVLYPDLGLNEMQRALADMLVMSETRAIFGSKSQFSRFATLYGNVTHIYIHPFLEQASMKNELAARFSDLERADALVADILSAYGWKDTP